MGCNFQDSAPTWSDVQNLGEGPVRALRRWVVRLEGAFEHVEKTQPRSNATVGSDILFLVASA